MSTENIGNVTITVPPDFIEEANDFFSAYEHLKTITCPEYKMQGLRLKELRVCRFCGRSFPATTFKSKAHVFPEQCGNRYMISDEESDSCN